MGKEVHTVPEIEEASQKDGQFHNGEEQSTARLEEGVGCVILLELLNPDDSQQSILALWNTIGHQMARIESLVSKNDDQSDTHQNDPKVQPHTRPPSRDTENGGHKLRAQEGGQDNGG